MRWRQVIYVADLRAFEPTGVDAALFPRSFSIVESYGRKWMNRAG